MKEVSFFYIFKNLIYSVFSLENKEKFKIFFALVIIFIGIMAGAIAPLMLRKIINALEYKTYKTLSLLIILCFFNALAWTINQISSTISWLLIQNTVAKISSNLCKDTFLNVLSFDYEYFLKNDLKLSISAIEKIFYSVPLIFSNICIYIIPSISDLFLAFCVFTYLYGLYYSILLILLFLVFMGCTFFGILKLDFYDEIYRKKNENCISYITHILSNFEVVKAFGTENLEKKNLEKLLLAFEKILKKRTAILDGIQIAQTIACGIFIGLFCIITLFFVHKNILNPGDFVLVNSYLIQFMTPLTYLSYVFSEFYKGISNLKSTFELKEKEIEDHSHLPLIKIEKASVEFKNITFERENNRKILDNINFSIEDKKTVAIVGESGSGKSTCIKLLLKFLNSTSGKILINNYDVSEMNPAFLRSQISFVPQESVIFPGSIKENILYGTNKDFDIKHLNKILKKSELEKFISQLSDGIDTSLDNLQISGGEKQRISFARALIRDPKICIFDEPTSALDGETRLEIKETIESFFGKFTIFIVTHDLDLIKKADLIIVLKNGKIVESGNHNKLIKNKNYYYNLYKSSL